MVCAMASFLDDGVGNVTAALKAAGIYENTIIIFTSDNGGPTNGDEVCRAVRARARARVCVCACVCTRALAVEFIPVG
jgi:hypothetical protein